jgi:pyruvate/2-oxoglutarate dehydrogenase complex dihydrolipoamide dehydrogenase (E3) component
VAGGVDVANKAGVVDAVDVVALGGGIAGGRVAVDVARGGKSVTLVEAGLVGGESPYLACIPSNSLLRSARGGETWEHAAARRDALIGGLDDSAAASRLAAAGVTLIRGTGQVTAPGTVTVTPGISEISYSELVVATGSEPLAPPIEGLADIQVWTTAEALTSPDLPRRLIILGGGPAGCELAQIYAAFGSQVTLVETEDRLLCAEPAFAGEILADGTRVEADRLLLASGRRPRLTGLGLDVLGIEVTPGMPLPVDESCRVRGEWGDGQSPHEQGSGGNGGTDSPPMSRGGLGGIAPPGATVSGRRATSPGPATPTWPGTRRASWPPTCSVNRAAPITGRSPARSIPIRRYSPSA